MRSSSSSSIRKVAQHAGVSVATVSRVINNSDVPTAETRAKVLSAVRDLNYQPDPVFRQAFRQQRSGMRSSHSATHTLGFLTSEFIRERAQNDDGYYSRVLAGIQKSAQQGRYHLMWTTMASDSLTLPDIVIEGRVDGLLIEGKFSELLQRILVQRLPIVFIDLNYPIAGGGSVRPNIERTVREALDYLWELGHRNVVTFQGAPMSLQNEIYLGAFKRYFEGKQTPIPYPDLCEPRIIDPESHARVMADFARQVAAAQPRPTAVTTWDTYACSLIVEFQRLGLNVPQDISLTGLDDTAAARLSSPQLTSYRFPMDEMGRSAAELLIQSIQERGRPARHLLIDGQLIERASCAAVTSDQLSVISNQ